MYAAYDRKPDYSNLDVLSRMYPSTKWIRHIYEDAPFELDDKFDVGSNATRTQRRISVRLKGPSTGAL